jgi:selenide,water dikinase
METVPKQQADRIRLTSYSHGAGCACKLGQTDLAEILSHLPGIEDPRVLVDAATRDDAAVFQFTADRALVATTDFFTPLVDDAATWGAIAATNALSDIYAMGAIPLFALNLVGWPREKLPFELLGEVLRGALEVAKRAHCLVLGGHSIDSLEPHFGMAVIGEARPERLFTVAGGLAGDILVLTKPLGTGVLTTALKRGRITEEALGEAIRSMTTLNDGAMRAARSVRVLAATDVTGFGLIGHLGNIARASRLGAEVDFGALPFMAGAQEQAAAGMISGGTRRNLEAATNVTWPAGLSETDRLLACDAQTSGGLLIAVRPERLSMLTAELKKEGCLAAAVIGRLTEGPAGTITVTGQSS